MNKLFESYKFAPGVLEQMLTEYNNTEFNHFGELGEQRLNIVDLSNVSHRVTKLSSDDFEYEILDTPSGKILEKIINIIKFKPRILGETTSDGLVINARLISIDACYE